MGAAVLAAGAMLSTASAEGGGLRRRRSSHEQYRSSRQSPQHVENGDGRRLTEDTAATTSNTGDELARRFFLPASHQQLDDIDMRRLIMEMDLASMSIMTPEPTPPPTVRPTQSPTISTEAPSISTKPTLTNCDDPGTCANRLRQQIYDITVRVGTPVDALDDPSSPQYQASEWIIEECDTDPPIDFCTETQIILNEQRYALAVMYFSLGGDGWNAGANPGLARDAGEGTWLSGLNYCDWGAEISGAGGESYDQLLCDEFGNVLNLNLRECQNHGSRMLASTHACLWFNPL